MGARYAVSADHNLSRGTGHTHDISRIVSGKIRLNVQPVDFPEVVRNALEAISTPGGADGRRTQ